MGQHGAHIADVILDDCQVPAGALLSDTENQGFKTAMKVLDRGRLHISALCVGIAERLIRDSLAYAMERQQFGKPIAEFQLVQAMLADSRVEAYAARCMVLDAAMRRDAGDNVGTEASCCKLFASEMVGRVADRAVQIHGGAGYVVDHGVERFSVDAVVNEGLAVRPVSGPQMQAAPAQPQESLLIGRRQIFHLDHVDSRKQWQRHA